MHGSSYLVLQFHYLADLELVSASGSTPTNRPQTIPQPSDHVAHKNENNLSKHSASSWTQKENILVASFNAIAMETSDFKKDSKSLYKVK